MRFRALVILLLVAFNAVPASAGGREPPPLPPVPIPPRLENPDTLYDGYRWYQYAWVPAYITVETWYRRAPVYSWGAAVFYGPNVMEGTARYRRLSLEGYLDGVAMMSPADIGRTVWLKRAGYDWEGPFLVVDCAQRDDMWPIVRYRHEVVEVGFKTAARWGMVIPETYGYKTLKHRLDDVEVYVGDYVPNWLADGVAEDWEPIPVYYPLWFVEGAEFVVSRDLDSPEPIAKKDGCWLYRDSRQLLCPEDYPPEPFVFPPRGGT